jgi:hypothetical protein
MFSKLAFYSIKRLHLYFLGCMGCTFSLENVPKAGIPFKIASLFFRLHGVFTSTFSLDNVPKVGIPFKIPYLLYIFLGCMGVVPSHLQMFQTLVFHKRLNLDFLGCMGCTFSMENVPKGGIPF